MRTIDISADLGESYGNWRMGRDADLMPLLTTAHVACGFHASDPVTMRETVALAVGCGLAIGAHPGLPDRLGFGRRVMAISAEDAYAYTAYQIGALQAFLTPHGREVTHVIPHGAFYHLVARDRAIAAAVARAAQAAMARPGLYYPAPRSAYLLAEEAEARRFATCPAYYPDLEYKETGELVFGRKMKGADTTRIYDQVKSLLTDGFIQTHDGKPLALDVAGIGFHGDGPNAIEVAQAVREAVLAAGCRIGPWIGPWAGQKG
ncbi:MAG: 5-oxoprolinase subunit PxpA [Rhodobacteraceae bacterium]|jgi:UPF0271 protein|nr:5-oxoprolinase subunit PxpA [Paracoccaceae bacterium]